MRMILAGFLFCAVLAVTLNGCGGGGGDDGNVCEDYCNSAWSRAVECELITEAAKPAAVEACILEKEVDEVSDATCRQAEALIGTMTCEQLWTLIEG